MKVIDKTSEGFLLETQEYWHGTRGPFGRKNITISDVDARIVVHLSQGGSVGKARDFLQAVLLSINPDLDTHQVQYNTHGDYTWDRQGNNWSLPPHGMSSADAEFARATVFHGDGTRPPAEKIHPPDKVTQPEPTTGAGFPGIRSRRDMIVEDIHNIKYQEFLVGLARLAAGAFEEVNTPNGKIIRSGTAAEVRIEVVDGARGPAVSVEHNMADEIIDFGHRLGTNVEGVLRSHLDSAVQISSSTCVGKLANLDK